MSEVTVGIAGVVGVVLCIGLGVNVMVALALVGLLGIVGLAGMTAATSMFGNVFFSVVYSFHFSVIPMFMLMGFFAMRAGMGEDLFEAATKWLGKTPGGLALATTGSAAAFGGVSGSSVGTAILFTKLALPAMLARGYDKRFAAASIAIAGTLAVLIPPSALIVVYGILTDASIGPLLLAGVIPGIVFAGVLCVTILAIAIRNPRFAPRVAEQVSWRERFWSLRLIGPLAFMMAIMIGGLYLGAFTPTEAGAIGAAVTLLMALLRQRGIRGIQLRAALRETVQLSAMIFAVVVTGLIFSRFLALSGLTNLIGDTLSGGQVPAWLVVLIITIVYVILGMLMDAPALLAVSLPITHPVMMKLGYDPLWFGIYVVVLAELGAVTPPVGINCFVVKSAAGNLVTLEDVFAGLGPFIVACFAMLGILLLFPGLALWLPQSMHR